MGLYDRDYMKSEEWQRRHGYYPSRPSNESKPSEEKKETKGSKRGKAIVSILSLIIFIVFTLYALYQISSYNTPTNSSKKSSTKISTYSTRVSSPASRDNLKFDTDLGTLNVGYVDINKILESHPMIEKAKEDINDFAIKAKADYQKKLDKAVENKTAVEAQQLKTEYENKLNQVVAQKQQEILKPILNDISLVVREVSKRKGIGIVLRGEVVVVGGVDITEDVIEAINR